MDGVDDDLVAGSEIHQAELILHRLVVFAHAVGLRFGVADAEGEPMGIGRKTRRWVPNGVVLVVPAAMFVTRSSSLPLERLMP